VHVNNGGQAVIGVVEGGGVKAKLEGQSHGKQITDASIQAMWSQDEGRDALPVTSNDQRPLSDARRNKPRRTKG